MKRLRASPGNMPSAFGGVTQAPSIYGDLSVRDNLRYFARVLGADDARVAEITETVGLEQQSLAFALIIRQTKVRVLPGP